MNALLRGILSIFDLGGVLHRPPEPPPKRDERTDAEKLEADWRKFLDW